jgi:predicted transcriptional regulator
MGQWKKFESTVVRLKRSYENTGSVVCLTTKGRQLEQNFEELFSELALFSVEKSFILHFIE